MLTYDDLTTRLMDWAAQDPGIRAALVLGSRARRDHPADAWSDLDILVFATDLERLVGEASWATARVLIRARVSSRASWRGVGLMGSAYRSSRSPFTYVNSALAFSWP